MGAKVFCLFVCLLYICICVIINNQFARCCKEADDLTPPKKKQTKKNKQKQERDKKRSDNKQDTTQTESIIQQLRLLTRYKKEEGKEVHGYREQELSPFCYPQLQDDLSV